MRNPRYSLTLDQARQLTNLLRIVEHEIDQDRRCDVFQQLRRAQPVLSKRQIFFLCMTLAKSKHDVLIPEFLIELRESSQNKQGQTK